MSNYIDVDINKSRAVRRHAHTSMGNYKRQKSPEEKVLDILK